MNEIAKKNWQRLVRKVMSYFFVRNFVFLSFLYEKVTIRNFLYKKDVHKSLFFPNTVVMTNILFLQKVLIYSFKERIALTCNVFSTYFKSNTNYRYTITKLKNVNKKGF